jgi:O-methyltransferase
VLPVLAALAERGARRLAEGGGIMLGDFFEEVPAADVYVLSAVLQDWDDATGARILRNVAEAALPGARLVVIDMVVPSGDTPHPTKMIDITMLGMLGGKQRSEPEWRALLAAGGFSLQRVVTGSGSHSALEAILA